MPTAEQIQQVMQPLFPGLMGVPMDRRSVTPRPP